MTDTAQQSPEAGSQSQRNEARRGTRREPSLAPVDAAAHPEFLSGDGEMARAMREKDWAETPLGPAANWPQSLKTVVRILLTSRYQMWMGWGRELTFLYNDAYRPTLGVKHDWALGQSAREVWKEIWPDIGPRIEHVLATGEATWDEGLLLVLERSGYPEETYHTFSYSPLADDAGEIVGMFCVVMEETERIIGERRLLSLRELASEISGKTTPEGVLGAAERQLKTNRKDLPFTLTYLFDGDGDANLAAVTGANSGDPMAPRSSILRTPILYGPPARSSSGVRALWLTNSKDALRAFHWASGTSRPARP